VLGCREPLPGLHERYVAVRWPQVLGSTLHGVAAVWITLKAAEQARDNGSAREHHIEPINAGKRPLPLGLVAAVPTIIPAKNNDALLKLLQMVCPPR
jgi:hypothetical protein